MADDHQPGSSTEPPGPGWWQASDGNWYPPEQHPDRAQPPAPGWWLASDGNWYPPERQEPASPVPTPPVPPGAPPAAPPSAAPPVPPSQPLPTPAAAARSHAASSSSSGGSTALIVGAVVVAAVVGLAVFLLLARSSDDDDEPDGTDVAASSTPAAGSPDDEPAPSPTTASTASDPVASGDGECGYLGPDDFDDLHAELRFTSPFDSARDLNVNFVLIDGDGQRFLTSSAFIEAAQPGEEFRFDADTLEKLPASVTDEAAVTCEIIEIAEVPFAEPPEVPADADCVVTGVDSFGDVQVELTVPNPVDALTDLSVDYALRGDGVRFGSGFTFVEQVPPGETVRNPDDSFTDAPTWTDDLTCQIIDIDAFDF